MDWELEIQIEFLQEENRIREKVAMTEGIPRLGQVERLRREMLEDNGAPAHATEAYC